MRIKNLFCPESPVEVDYFGLKLVVQNGGWIATDKHGLISWYDQRPHHNDLYWSNYSHERELVMVDFDGEDWTQTLVEVCIDYEYS